MRNSILYPKPQHRVIVIVLVTVLTLFALDWPLRLLETAGARPDILTALALYFTLWTNPRGRYLPCMALGLMRDMFSVGPVGTYAILYSLLYRLLESRRHRIPRTGMLSQLAIGFLGTVAINVGYHAALVVFGDGVGWRYALVQGLLTAMLSAPLMLVVVYVMSVGLKGLGVRKLPGNMFNV